MPTLNPFGTVPPSSLYSEVNSTLKQLHQARQRRLTHQLKLVQLVVPNGPEGKCVCRASVYECVGESLGSIMWEGSLALAYFMLSRNLCTDRNALRILELGAGTGVAGLLLSSVAQRSHFTLTDLPLLMPLLQKNVVCNGKEKIIHTQSLAWGTEDTRQLDGSFDYILAADVVYCAELIEPLLHTLRAVADHRCTVLMAYRYRGPEEERFFTLAGRDFCIEKVHFEQDWDQGLSIRRIVDDEETAREAAFERSLAAFRGTSKSFSPSHQNQVCQFAPHTEPLCIFTMKRRSESPNFPFAQEQNDEQPVL